MVFVLFNLVSPETVDGTRASVIRRRLIARHLQRNRWPPESIVRHRFSCARPRVRCRSTQPLATFSAGSRVFAGFDVGISYSRPPTRRNSLPKVRDELPVMAYERSDPFRHERQQTAGMLNKGRFHQLTDTSHNRVLQRLPSSQLLVVEPSGNLQGSKSPFGEAGRQCRPTRREPAVA